MNYENIQLIVDIEMVWFESIPLHFEDYDNCMNNLKSNFILQIW